MLISNLNNGFALLCLAVITGAPFFFRYWVKQSAETNEAVINKMTSLFSTSIFISLFTGAFVFSSDSRVMGEALLGASVLSFGLLYQFRWSAVQGAAQIRRNAPKAFRASAVKLAFVLVGLALLALFRAYPATLALLLTIPFTLPLFIRLKNPCQKMAVSPFKNEIFSVFRKAKVPLQEIYIVDAESENASLANAWVSGSRFGKGIFGRTLFISLGLIEKLNEDEVHAVLLHEASHFKMNHGLKRILLGSLFIVLSVYWIAIPLTFLFPKDPSAILLATILSLVVQFLLLGRLVYRQELEADLGAIHEGASSNALISALQKLSGDQYQVEPSTLTRLTFGFFHPSGETREKTILEGKIETNLSIIPYRRYAFGYSLFVMGFVFWSASQLNEVQNRAPAADRANSAKISR